MLYPRDPAPSVGLKSLIAATPLLSTRLAAAPLDTPQGSPGTGDPLTGVASELFSEAFFLRLGFSFMIGLAMGFALKVAFKIALLALGFLALSLFALQFYGLIDINWSGLEPHYDNFAHGLRITGSAFLDFAAENLSSAASFFAGLAIGLKF